MTQTDPAVRPRAVHLIEYLDAVRLLREKPVRDIAEYRDKRWWAGDLPDHPSCSVTLDPDTGTITVEPDALVPHQLEAEVLQGLNLSGFDLLLDVREGFRADPVGPFDPRARNLYGRLLSALGQDGEIVEARTPLPPRDEPRITDTWVLMVRRRSTMYRRFFGDLRTALDAGQIDVPAPLVAVVADEPGKLDLEGNNADGGDSGSWHRAAERLLMPLPTNPEQEAVARRLALHRGVTVQGPPGTG